MPNKKTHHHHYTHHNYAKHDPRPSKVYKHPDHLNRSASSGPRDSHHGHQNHHGGLNMSQPIPIIGNDRDRERERSHERGHDRSHDRDRDVQIINPTSNHYKPPRRPTWAKKVKDEMIQLKESKNSYNPRNYPELDLLRSTLSKTRYRYQSSGTENIPNYPFRAMQSLREFYNNEKNSYRVGSLFNSNIIPTLVKSKSTSRILEIKSFRQNLRLGAISEQINTLNRLVNESCDSNLIKGDVME